MSDADRTPPENDEPDDFGTLFDELEELHEIVDSPAERRQVREAMRAAVDAGASESPVFGRVIWGFDRGDLAESLLGSLLFSIPMAVEGGTRDAGLFIAQHLLYFVGTVSTAIATVIVILYVADIQDVRIANRIFGVVPRRLVGVTGTAAVVSIALMTAWGMVTWSTDPAVVWQSLCICSVTFVPTSIGAALGDILPGS